MLKVQRNNNSGGGAVVVNHARPSAFTEYEEDIHFDEDDPDFLHLPSIFFTLPANNATMSLASVHPVELHSSQSSLTLSHSLEDVSTSWSSQVEQQVLTIEQLRDQLTSCFTCGVSWSDQHVSLDCRECGGYSLERPCPECDGRCGSMWKRDLTTSHANGKARWLGECLKEPDPLIESTNSQQELLCQRLEKLTAASSWRHFTM